MSEALIEAVKSGDLNRVRTELEGGADVNAAGTEQEWTALNHAAGKGQLPLVEALVAAGADVFKTGRDNRTPYKIAIAAGHAEVARFLADAEAKAGGDTERVSSREHETRPYCKAFYLKDLRRFDGWSESKINWTAEGDVELTDDDIVFIHQDRTVTRSMFHGEDVIMQDVTPAWEAFTAETLGFKVPDDFDLMPSRAASGSAAGGS